MAPRFSRARLGIVDVPLNYWYPFAQLLHHIPRDIKPLIEHFCSTLHFHHIPMQQSFTRYQGTFVFIKAFNSKPGSLSFLNDETIGMVEYRHLEMYE